MKKPNYSVPENKSYMKEFSDNGAMKKGHVKLPMGKKHAHGTSYCALNDGAADAKEEQSE
jgi:hypothetical protein